jgi:hypothetical protein
MTSRTVKEQRVLPVLEVACNRCGRHGKLRTAALLAKHGSDLPIPKPRHIIAADCRRTIEGKIADPCGMHFSGVAG